MLAPIGYLITPVGYLLAVIARDVRRLVGVRRRQRRPTGHRELIPAQQQRGVVNR